MHEKVLTESELLMVEEHNLRKWKKWLHEDCPVSVDNPAELWKLIENNEIMPPDLERTIHLGLVGATPRRPAEESQSYRAAVALKLLRQMGFLPIPVDDGSRPYYF